MTESHSQQPSRRSFLQTGSAVALGAATLSQLRAHAYAGATDETIRVALVGAGGRGTGAAAQALSTAGPVKLVAVADAFQDRIDQALRNLGRDHTDRMDVPPERQFTGFDAYKKAIDAGADLVILTTPPGFRPIHFEYAVQQGKNVFMEKPVAVDGPGIRRVLAAAQIAKQKNLKVGVGLQRHHETKYQETVKRIQDGEIGKVILLRAYWNGGGVWVRPREPQQNEMEYQMRNWYYFNWLCGDHIVEQHIHNLDVCNWIMGGPPVTAQGQGGRQVRVGSQHGEIFDHHMVEFTYADGTKLLSQCRHIQNCWNSVSEHAHGSKGSSNVGGGRIDLYEGEGWRFRGQNKNPYQVEHDVLFDAVRNDKPHNEAEYGAHSTLTSIVGRMATYSGKEVKFEEALNSTLALEPSEYSWDGVPPTVPGPNGEYPIPMPGSTKAW
ncbi:MAG: Gfo/Idh/MocA family oxidoreductase [Planctomycetes bacterium]|nr:Gfo/Idh/MocA family oxidoreductase [Planctomycetota bacterium]